MRIEKLRQAFDIETVLVHFPLHPETPAEGRSMAELYAWRNIDPEAMYPRMKGLMDAEGLPYGRRTHTYNSRLAQELGKWADTQPGGEAIHDALYRAYFVDARNIGDPEVLVEIAQSVGLPAEEARAVLAERRFKDAVDADWAKSRAIRRDRGPDLCRRPATASSAPSPTRCWSSWSTRRRAAPRLNNSLSDSSGRAPTGRGAAHCANAGGLFPPINVQTY